MMAELDITPVKNNCPADGFTRQEEVKQLLEQIESKFPGAKKKFLASIENVDQSSFWI